MFSHITFIINPAAATNTPLLAQLNDTLKKTTIQWDVLITKKKGDAITLTQQAIASKTKCVVVYGGDGTVMEVARTLIGTNIPLAILPAGTANVVAKEFSIPLTVPEALALIASPKPHTQKIDTAVCNNTPFLIRVNYGVLSNMVTSAPRKAKKTFGQLAYGVSAFKELNNQKPLIYSLTIDGKKYRIKAVALTITNVGNIGISGLSFSPLIKTDDGKLDLIAIRKVDLPQLFSWAKTTVMQEKPTNIFHRHGKKITISTSKKHSIILDDQLIENKKITITINPKSLVLVVPPKK